MRAVSGPRRSRAASSSGSRSAGRCCTGLSWSSWTSLSPGSTPTAPPCSTASSRRCAGSGRCSSPRTTRSGSSPSRAGGSPLRSYLSDAAVLARKDLRLELRARDTLPAMLLFVLSVLAVFHFALPSGSSRLAEFGLLWVAIVFTALLGLGRAFVAEREQGLLDALVLAPCDRSTIWLAKGIATFAFLAVAELVALPAFALFFRPVGWGTIAAVVVAAV